MSDLQDRLRSDLTAALRQRDTSRVRVLRTLVSTLANAEAQPEPEQGPTSLRSGGSIAGAAEGLAAAEVARRELGEELERRILREEHDEWLRVAAELSIGGADAAARTLRDDADVVATYLM